MATSRAMVLIGLAAATSASADPALFTGIGQQSGGILGVTPVTTLTGPTTAAPGIASVTSNGDFTVPALAFSRNTPGYTFSIPPVYPYAFARINQQNAPGSFVRNYVSPSVPITVAGTNAIVPNVTGTPRAGFVRVVPGPQGFGGRMPVVFDKYYLFDIATSLGILKARAQDNSITFGGASLGAFAPGGTTPNGRGGSTYPSGSPQYAVTNALGTAKGPWITGMATAYEPHGAVITTTSRTATDARAVFDTGTISLVTPRIQYIYQGDGTGTLLNLRDAFGIVHSVEIIFAPEPATGAMIAAGSLGLAAVGRVRRARRVRT
jgi:hypothetical protein